MDLTVWLISLQDCNIVSNRVWNEILIINEKYYHLAKRSSQNTAKCL